MRQFVRGQILENGVLPFKWMLFEQHPSAYFFSHCHRQSIITWNTSSQQGELVLHTHHWGLQLQFRSSSSVRDSAPALQHVPLLERRSSSKSHSQCAVVMAGWTLWFQNVTALKTQSSLEYITIYHWLIHCSHSDSEESSYQPACT